MPIPILVQYNIPRYFIGKPGRQNRVCTGSMSIIPGLTQPFEFIYVNTDGVPINLTGFTLRLVFWFPQTEYELLPANMGGNIVLAKDLTVSDPYLGTAGVLLSDQETLQLNTLGRPTLRWSIYMIDSETTNTFATQITAEGDPWGLCYINHSDVPIADVIKGVSLSTC